MQHSVVQDQWLEFAMGRLVLAFCLLTALVLVTSTASAYPVKAALTLGALADDSDVIFKGTVVSTKPVDDASFRETQGYRPHETTFRLHSVVKGDLGDAKEIQFRHYAPSEGSFARGFMPQNYDFKVGAPYIVCAKVVENQPTLRQIWDAHHTKEDQGVLKVTSGSPHVGDSLEAVYWHELQLSLKSSNPDHVIYAIGQLDEMSGVGHSAHPSLKRKSVVEAIVPLVDASDDQVALRAIKSLGMENPNLGGNIWTLIRLNPSHFPGHSTAEPLHHNNSAKRFSSKLIEVAQSNRSVELRTIAIQALGGTDNEELVDLARRWSSEDDERIRAASTVLLGEYADQIAGEYWQELLGDKAATVRFAATRAIAIGQQTQLLADVEKLLADKDTQVVAGAAACLLSFPIDKSRETLKRQIGHPEFGCLFVNALAIEDTELYAKQLGDTIRKRPNPKGWWGGRVPWGRAWNLLFKHVQAQNQSRFRIGELDEMLASLESPIRENERSVHYSSSEPRDLYALYVQRNLGKRAREYRKAVNDKTPYNMEQFFERVDKHPHHFLRN